MHATAAIVDDANKWCEFLLNASEGSRVELRFDISERLLNSFAKLEIPSILLPCHSALCKGNKYMHDPADKLLVRSIGPFVGPMILQYRCRHCTTNAHYFALVVNCVDEEDDQDEIVNHYNYASKFGQTPPRGGPLPSAVLNMCDTVSKELFRKGLESERHSLGIAALAYYRRALERIHVEVLNQIRSVVPTDKQRKIIDNALKQRGLRRRFQKASTALPDSLRAGTNNPLLLINGCLNDGLHDGPTDAECLLVAHLLLSSLTNLVTGIRDMKRFAAEAAKTNVALQEFRTSHKSSKQAPSIPKPGQISDEGALRKPADSEKI